MLRLIGPTDFFAEGAMEGRGLPQILLHEQSPRPIPELIGPANVKNDRTDHPISPEFQWKRSLRSWKKRGRPDQFRNRSVRSIFLRTPSWAEGGDRFFSWSGLSFLRMPCCRVALSPEFSDPCPRTFFKMFSCGIEHFPESSVRDLYFFLNLQQLSCTFF